MCIIDSLLWNIFNKTTQINLSFKCSMYVRETFLAGILWNALERILERVRNANGTGSERKSNAFGTQMERVQYTNNN